MSDGDGLEVSVESHPFEYCRSVGLCDFDGVGGVVLALAQLSHVVDGEVVTSDFPWEFHMTVFQPEIGAVEPFCTYEDGAAAFRAHRYSGVGAHISRF